jgi:NAD(P)H-hydrate epimerase
LPHNDLGQIAFEASRPTLERLLADADVLAMGPGLGQSEDTRFLVRWVLTETDLPTVLDADGLNALVGQVDVLETVTRPLILTPHPGELSRLIDRRISEIQRDRIGHAAMLARPVGPLIVVLKGHGTVVTDGERLHVNETGNPGMATGGSGDVLTGVIGALLGQGLSPFEAAVLGVHAHGLAGDIARDQGGEIGMIAGDIVDSLPDAFYHLAQG